MPMVRLALRKFVKSDQRDIAAESHHRIANHLAILASVVRMQIRAVSQGSEALSRADVRLLLNDILDKIISVGELQRMLSGSQHDEEVDLQKYVRDSCAAVVSAMGLNAQAKIITEFSADCHATPEQAQSMAMIANEIVVNAIKHAHPTGIPVLIRLQCKRTGDGKLMFEIEDDGIGLAGRLRSLGRRRTRFHPDPLACRFSGRHHVRRVRQPRHILPLSFRLRRHRIRQHAGVVAGVTERQLT